MRNNVIALLVALLPAFHAGQAQGAPALGYRSPVSSCGAKTGILVLAHGVSSHHGGHHPQGDDPWELTVRETVRTAKSRIPYPVELAFGMWSQKNFQTGVDALVAQGICRLVIVPFFVSSHSVVINTQRYQFHLTEENPLPFDPGRIRIPGSVRETKFQSALDDHVLLSEVLRDRLRGLSTTPENDEAIFVAHGPVSEEDDRLWLKDLAVHARRICDSQGMAASCNIHPFTLQDDALPPIRHWKTLMLRQLVGEITARGHNPVIVPVLLAPGGIEKGLIERLQGLTYRYNGRMLAPDPRLADWLVERSKDVDFGS